MLLNVLSRERGGVDAMRALIRDCHETDVTKRKLRAKAFELFRSLVDRQIIEIIPREQRKPGYTPLRVNVDLQVDFSLNQTLSLYLIDTLKLLDAEAPDYAVRVLSLVESIHENPDAILRKQLGRIKTQRMAEMKNEGLEYEERMAELERLEYPKPDRDFIYDTFNAFSAAHPWVGQESIRPKSVAREMYEAFHTFDEYIREYDLQRSEGLLLRYLSYVYTSLAQTVPDPVKTDELRAIEVYFGTMIRDVDSSLLDEWRGLSGRQARERGSPEGGTEVAPADDSLARLVTPRDITRERKEFTVLVRNAVFKFLRALMVKDYAGALAQMTSQEDVAIRHEDLESLLRTHESDHGGILLDAAARGPQHTRITTLEQGLQWKVEQTLTDPEGHNDWVVEFLVDLDKSRDADKPVLSLVRVGPME